MKIGLTLLADYWNRMGEYGSPKLKNIFKMSVILLSHGTILTIIHNHLEKKKVSMGWVWKILTDDHKMNHIAATAQFLTLYNGEGKNLFNRTVTSDEKWVHHLPKFSKIFSPCF